MDLDVAIGLLLLGLQDTLVDEDEHAVEHPDYFQLPSIVPSLNHTPTTDTPPFISSRPSSRGGEGHGPPSGTVLTSRAKVAVWHAVGAGDGRAAVRAPPVGANGVEPLLPRVRRVPWSRA